MSIWGDTGGGGGGKRQGRRRSGKAPFLSSAAARHLFTGTAHSLNTPSSNIASLPSTLSTGRVCLILAPLNCPPLSTRHPHPPLLLFTRSSHFRLPPLVHCLLPMCTSPPSFPPFTGRVCLSLPSPRSRSPTCTGCWVSRRWQTRRPWRRRRESRWRRDRWGGARKASLRGGGT